MGSVLHNFTLCLFLSWGLAAAVETAWPILNPTSAYVGEHKSFTVWQIPLVPVRKVLFIAHPKDRGPEDFWDFHPNCPICKGLPENRAIVLDALRLHYAVIAIATIDKGKLWESWPPESPDIGNVVSILKTFLRDNDLQNVPLVGLGISAGGELMSTLALSDGFFESIVMMISGGNEQAWELVNGNFPPTFFMYEPKDYRENMGPAFEKLGSRSVPIGQAVWHEVPVTPDWFAQRIPLLNVSISKAIRAALREVGVLDENYLFALPPMASTDDEFLALYRPYLPLPEDPSRPGYLRWEESIMQELRVAEAFHMTVSLKDELLFQWFEGAYESQLTVSIQ